MDVLLMHLLYMLEALFLNLSPEASSPAVLSWLIAVKSSGTGRKPYKRLQPLPHFANFFLAFIA
jgi:hypothetical protein